MSQQDVPHGECTLSLTPVNGFSQALVVLGMTTEDIRVTHVFIFSVTNKKNDSGGYVSFVLLQGTVQGQTQYANWHICT